MSGTPSPLEGENKLQIKLYTTSEDRKSFSSVPLMYVILNKELLLSVTSSFQINQTFGHRAVFSSLTISSKDKTVILFSSKCKQQHTVLQSWWVFPLFFYFFFLFIMSFIIKSSIFFPACTLLLLFKQATAPKISISPSPPAEVWAACLPETVPVAEE